MLFNCECKAFFIRFSIRKKKRLLGIVSHTSLWLCDKRLWSSPSHTHSQHIFTNTSTCASSSSSNSRRVNASLSVDNKINIVSQPMWFGCRSTFLCAPVINQTKKVIMKFFLSSLCCARWTRAQCLLAYRSLLGRATCVPVPVPVCVCVEKLELTADAIARSKKINKIN